MMDQQVNYPGGQSPSGSSDSIKLGWNALPLGHMILFSLKLLFFRIITIGIYTFWGRTQTRRKVWSSITLQGQPFEYTGRGMELFLGFLVAVFAVFLPFILILVGIQVAFGPNSPIAGLVTFPIYLGVFYLIGVAQYSARRYRLSRTTWRGIRGGMNGSAWAYGWTSLWTSILLPFTLGWALPWQMNLLQRKLTEDTHFGETPMKYDGGSGALYGPFALMWFANIVVMVLAALLSFGPEFLDVIQRVQTGNATPDDRTSLVLSVISFYVILVVGMMVSSTWFFVRTFNHFAASTTFDNARFKLNAHFMSFMGLLLSNLLILIVSFGILLPIIQYRSVWYFIKRMSIEGSIDFESIAQSQQKLESMGEGLATAFDVDLF